jgi:hypothetical protein
MILLSVKDFNPAFCWFDVFADDMVRLFGKTCMFLHMIFFVMINDIMISFIKLKAGILRT